MLFGLFHFEMRRSILCLDGVSNDYIIVNAVKGLDLYQKGNDYIIC